MNFNTDILLNSLLLILTLVIRIEYYETTN